MCLLGRKRRSSGGSTRTLRQSRNKRSGHLTARSKRGVSYTAVFDHAFMKSYVCGKSKSCRNKSKVCCEYSLRDMHVVELATCGQPTPNHHASCISQKRHLHIAVLLSSQRRSWQRRIRRVSPCNLSHEALSPWTVQFKGKICRQIASRAGFIIGLFRFGRLAATPWQAE